ncbi:MAG: hypothetical protein K1Y36_29285 [Blastocatellia bacterium]|nr:hypothetical protein [Blastocatellia bacterium]
MALTYCHSSLPSVSALTKEKPRKSSEQKPFSGLRFQPQTTNTIATIPVGNGISGIGDLAFNPNTKRLFSVNYYNGTVSAFNTETWDHLSTLYLADSLYGITVNPNTNRVYTTEGLLGSVVVIDGNSFTRVKTIPTLGAVLRLATNPNLNRIYALGQNGLYVIDGNTDTVVTTIPLQGLGTPDWITVNPITNRIYCAGTNSRSLIVFDGGTDSLVTSIFLGTTIWGLAVNSATNRIYASNTGDNQVLVFDGRNNSQLPSIAFETPRSLITNPTTNRVYISGYDPNGMAVVDGNTHQIIQRVHAPILDFQMALNPNNNQIYFGSQNQIGNLHEGDLSLTYTYYEACNPKAVGVNPNTGRAYIATPTQGVKVINSSTNTLVTIIPIPNGQPYRVAVNPQTNRIYVSTQGGQSLAVIEGETNRILANIPISPFTSGVEVNPNTNRIYVTDPYSGLLTVVDGNSNQIVATITVDRFCEDISINSASNRIFLGGPFLNVVDGNTNTVVNTIPFGRRPLDLCVNPTTNRVFVVSGSYGEEKIYVLEGTNGNLISSFPKNHITHIAVNPKTNRLYAAEDDFYFPKIRVLDGYTLNEVGSAPILRGVGKMAIDQSTSRVFVPSELTDTVTIVEDTSAVRLVFDQQPATTPVLGLAPPVTVKVLNGSNAVASDFFGTITLGLGNNPGNATLSGTRTVQAVNGSATFDNLSLNLVGTGYTLVASAQGLVGVTSQPFSVVVPSGKGPFITSIAPNVGSAGSQVTINGSNLNQVRMMTFNLQPATFTIDSPNQITALVPIGATTGPLVVSGPSGSFTGPVFTVLRTK